MDVTNFTATEIMECAATANAAKGSSSPPSDADYGRAFDSICAAGIVGMSAWGVNVRAHARDILLRKPLKASVTVKVDGSSCEAVASAAKKALGPWVDIGSLVHAAMRGVTPKVDIVSEEASAFAVVVGVDHQGPVDPFAYEGILRRFGEGRAVVLPTKPDPTTAPLDAMLRFLLGHPKGARWMGTRLRSEVDRIARKFRPDKQVEHRRTAGMAASLLSVCTQIDPGSTWQYLDRAEQQKYLRLLEALRFAVNQVPASGVRR